MDKEKLDETKQTVDEAKQMAKVSSKIATHAATGNVIGTAADSIKLASKKLKKMIKKALLKVLIIVIIAIALASSLFSTFNNIKNKLLQLLNFGSDRITSFWVNYSDREGWMDMTQRDYTVENSSEKYNIVEKYMIDMVQSGISLKQLRLFGDFEFSEEDERLSETDLLEKIIENPGGKYSKQKDTIERYISEFVRADVISQSMHRTMGSDNVNSGDENLIDGGIYLYRVTNSMDAGSGEIKNDDMKQMKYISPTKFDELFEANDYNELKYSYTLNTDTGELVYVNYEKDEEYGVEDISSNEDWFQDLRSWIKGKKDTNITSLVPTKRTVDYTLLVSKYSMPFEFLINLCMVTENPEFVYHVATLARDTSIDLVVIDNDTIEDVTDETYQLKYEYVRNDHSNSIEGADKQGQSEPRTRYTKIHTSEESIIKVKNANAWTFYEKFRIINTIEVNTVTGNVNDTGNAQTTLQEQAIYGEIAPASATSPPKWGRKGTYWDGSNVIAVDQTRNEVTTTINTFSIPENAEPSIEKSKQFLGLLRNSTGKCAVENCYRDSKKTYECAKMAVFNEEGKNVAYKIPSMTREETPLNNLTSGLQMLYQLLGANGVSSSKKTTDSQLTGEYMMNADAYLTPKDNVSDHIQEGESLQNRLESIYSEKMQHIVLHLQYLMTFPENENIDYSKDIESQIDDIYNLMGRNYIGNNYIVKTDEEGALPALSKEELRQLIEIYFSKHPRQKQNALSILDALYDGQEKYQVNAVFILAMGKKETSMGTAESSFVKKNNWLSWDRYKTAYNSPSDNVSTVMEGLGRKYFTQGKITICDIGYTYCPNDSAHPTQGDDWIERITNFVEEMYATLGYETNDYAESYNGSKLTDYNGTPYSGSAGSARRNKMDRWSIYRSSN